MELIKIFVCLSLFFLPSYLLATQLSCLSFYLHKENKLRTVSIYNSDQSGKYELAPAEKPAKGKLTKQYWNDIHTQEGKKVFLCFLQTLMVFAPLQISLMEGKLSLQHLSKFWGAAHN